MSQSGPGAVSFLSDDSPHLHNCHPEVWRTAGRKAVGDPPWAPRPSLLPTPTPGATCLQSMRGDPGETYDQVPHGS